MFIEETAKNNSDESGQQAQTAEVPQAAPEQNLADDQAQQIAELKNQLLRALADHENTRRRAEREREEAHKYAVQRFAKDLLNVADNLRRALESVPADSGDTAAAMKNVILGVEMTEKELQAVFGRFGVSALELKPGDAFNPEHHQAVMEVPTNDYPTGTIAHIIQGGYMLQDRLLRPALVGVAKSVSASE